MLALRLLKYHIQPYYDITLNELYVEMDQNGALQHINLAFAIEFITSIINLDADCGIILAVDEINAFFEDEHIPRSYVKSMLRGLAELKLKSSQLPFIFPIFAGTSYVSFAKQVKASSFGLSEFPLNLLSGSDVIRMVQQLSQQEVLPKFNTSRAFMQLLHDCAGLPRFVQYVCELAQDYFKETHKPMEEWDWHYLQDRILGKIGKYYNNLADGALADCLLGLEVNRNHLIGGVDAITWGELEMSGAVVLVKKVPVVPFLGLLKMAKLSADHVFTKLTVWPMIYAPHGTERCFTWQDWERFNMEFAVMKLTLLFKRFEGENVPLIKFLSAQSKSCNGSEELANILLVDCKPIYIESQHQIGPNCELIDLAHSGMIFSLLKPGHSIKNGVGGAADGLLVLQYVTVHDTTPSTLLLLYSMKWTEGSTLMKNEIPLEKEVIEEEYSKMKKHFRYLKNVKKLYVICTGKHCVVPNDELPADTIVIDKEVFINYFGPTFKSRAIFASVSPRRNPNTMNPQEILGIGPVSAQKIIEYRRQTPITKLQQILDLTPKNSHASLRQSLRFDDEEVDKHHF